MPASALPADALVAFGITGDLARQMTFGGLYRLARGSLLRCPTASGATDQAAEPTPAAFPTPSTPACPETPGHAVAQEHVVVDHDHASGSRNRDRLPTTLVRAGRGPTLAPPQVAAMAAGRADDALPTRGPR
jgi:hypothetical protein